MKGDQFSEGGGGLAERCGNQEKRAENSATFFRLCGPLPQSAGGYKGLGKGWEKREKGRVEREKRGARQRRVERGRNGGGEDGQGGKNREKKGEGGN